MVALLKTVLIMMLAGLPFAGMAQPLKFPERPIRLIIPFAAGGGTDIVARIVAQRLVETIGQSVIVEAKPGGGGVIAVAELMRAAPDGHVLLIATSSNAVLPVVAGLSWHPSNDFTPIAIVYSYPFVLATNSDNSQRFPDLAQFIARVRSEPDKVAWGSSGIGGPQHLVGEHFNKVAGLKMVHVPYKGNAPMIQALRANEVQVVFDTQTLMLPHIQEGRLKPLAITSAKRSSRLPDTPTLSEAGYPDLAVEITNYVLAPKGTPVAIQRELNRQFAAALEHPDVRDRLQGFGHTVPLAADNSPEAVKAHIDRFSATYGPLAREVGGANR